MEGSMIYLVFDDVKHLRLLTESAALAQLFYAYLLGQSGWESEPQLVSYDDSYLLFK